MKETDKLKQVHKLLNDIAFGMLKNLGYSKGEFNGNIFDLAHIEKDFERVRVFCLKLENDKRYFLIEFLIENWKITFLKFDFDTSENLGLNRGNNFSTTNIKENVVFGIDRKGRPKITRTLG